MNKEEKRLRKEIIFQFNITAKEWSKRFSGLKNDDIKMLFEEKVFEVILFERYGKNSDGSKKQETIE